MIGEIGRLASRLQAEQGELRTLLERIVTLLEEILASIAAADTPAPRALPIARDAVVVDGRRAHG